MHALHSALYHLVMSIGHFALIHLLFLLLRMSMSVEYVLAVVVPRTEILLSSNAPSLGCNRFLPKFDAAGES